MQQKENMLKLHTVSNSTAFYCLQVSTTMVLLLLLATCAASVLFFLFLVSRIYPWVIPDIWDIYRLAQIGKKEAKLRKNGTLPIDLFEGHARRCPEHPFLLFQDEVYSYGRMDRRTNQVARAALALGLTSGDVVAIFMENEPAFISAFYGEWTFLHM